jgi:hypothetical protein
MTMNFPLMFCIHKLFAFQNPDLCTRIFFDETRVLRLAAFVMYLLAWQWLENFGCRTTGVFYDAETNFDGFHARTDRFEGDGGREKWLQRLVIGQLRPDRRN